MEIYEYVENANVYSVPFDWSENEESADYVSTIVDHYFGTGTRVGSDWQPNFFGIINKKQKIGDVGSLSSDESIVISRKAADVLEPLIAKSVELLEYPTEIGPYYLVNVLDVGDYLDRAKTDCDRILTNGLCSGINKYVFKKELLVGRHIFSIPDMPGYRYVSGEFIEMCRKNNLQGIHLDESVKVWDSDD